MKPRLFLLILAALGAALTAPAQLNFGKLSQALDKAKQTTDKIVDTGKDVGKVVKGVAGIGPEEERNIGDSVALEIVGKFGGLVRDEETFRRVNLVGRSLARYSGRPDLNWRFGVLDSDTVNAFSAPDGYVFITRGLYELCPGDDELAGVLGHEIAHITGKHALNIVARNDAFGALNKQLSQRSSEARKVEVQLKQLNLSTDLILKTLFEKGFDPLTEYAADRTGHDLAALTGYAPGGLREVLVTLEQRGGDPQTVFSTHPPLAERIQRLPDEAAAPTP